MTGKTQGRADWHQATPKASSKYHSTGMASRVKAAIVTLALWDWLPISLAHWVIQRGGLQDD